MAKTKMNKKIKKWNIRLLNIISYITNNRKFTGAYIIETETFYKIPDREIETKSYCS